MSDAVGYYDRQNVVHLDGTRVFYSSEDERVEQEVADVLALAWRCELHQFGALSPVDWYATRMGRLTGVLELKSRAHAFGHYPTVFLNVRKWLALQLAGLGLAVPAIFVVKFTDGITWVPLSAINASAVRIGGGRRVTKSRAEIEPVIDVPISSLRKLS